MVGKGLLGMGVGKEGPRPPAVAVNQEVIGEGRRLSYEELEAAVKRASGEKRE